jgi:hypothetical protein
MSDPDMKDGGISVPEYSDFCKSGILFGACRFIGLAIRSDKIYLMGVVRTKPAEVLRNELMKYF